MQQRNKSTISKQTHCCSTYHADRCQAATQCRCIKCQLCALPPNWALFIIWRHGHGPLQHSFVRTPRRYRVLDCNHQTQIAKENPDASVHCPPCLGTLIAKELPAVLAGLPRQPSERIVPEVTTKIDNPAQWHSCAMAFMCITRLIDARNRVGWEYL
jgi:hypothetical protein